MGIKDIDGSLKPKKLQRTASPVTKFWVQKLRDDDNDISNQCILHFEDPIDVQELKNLLEKKLCRVPRFSSILRINKGSVYWESPENCLNIDDHLEEIDLTQDAFPGGEASSHSEEQATGLKSSENGQDPKSKVWRFANQVLNKPLAFDKPPWVIYILRHEKFGDCQGSLVINLNHSLGDGASLASLLREISRTPDGNEPQFPGNNSQNSKKNLSLLQQIGNSAMFIINTLFSTFHLLLLLVLPRQPIMAVEASNNQREIPREVAAVELQLSELKKIGKAHGATVNDVLVALLAAAIERAATREKSPAPAPLEVPAEDNNKKQSPLMKTKAHRSNNRLLHPHVLFIANLRPLLSSSEVQDMFVHGNEARSWGNKIGYIVAPLPVFKLEKSSDRVLFVKRATDRSKNSLEAYTSYMLIDSVCKIFGAKALYNLLLFVGSKVVMAMANLAGPQETIVLIKNRLLHVSQWTTGSPHGLSAHAISYDGVISVSFTARPDIIHAAEFAKLFQESFHEFKE